MRRCVPAVSARRTAAAVGPVATDRVSVGNSTGAISGHTPDDAVSALTAVAAVTVAAATVSRPGAAVSTWPVPAHSAAVVCSASSVGRTWGRITTAGVVDAEVDRPYHGTPKTELVSPGLLHCYCLIVVVTNPLVSPCDLLHHRIGEERRLEILLGYHVLNLTGRHDARKVGARGRFAWATERTPESVTARV